MQALDAHARARSPAAELIVCGPLQITSRMHALVAVQQALLARADGALKTKTIHSEVLWMLEPGSNVRTGVRAFDHPVQPTHLAPLSRSRRSATP